MKQLPLEIFFLLMTLLLIRGFLFYPKLKSLPEEKTISFVSVLKTTPKTNGTTQSFTLQPKGYEPMRITAPSATRFYYGEKLKITGKVTSSLLDNKKTTKTMYFPHVQVVREQGILFAIRQRITTEFEQSLPPDAARLLLGIVFGIKEPLSKEFQHDIQAVGLLHVIAASGMNVTLLVAGLLVIFSRFLRRREAICLCLAAIIVYALFAGLQASIVRASIMGGLSLVASFLGKQYFGFWSLIVTGFVMLIIDPTLFFDVGFQLSFLATLGIMELKPLLDAFLPESLSLVKEDLTTTSAAQILTLPILLMTFGQYNAISLLVNPLVLWMVAPLMIIGGVAALFSLFLPIMTHLLLLLCLPFLMIFAFITSIFARFPLSLQVSSFSPILLIGYYVLLYVLIYFIKRGRAHDKS